MLSYFIIIISLLLGTIGHISNGMPLSYSYLFESHPAEIQPQNSIIILELCSQHSSKVAICSKRSVFYEMIRKSLTHYIESHKRSAYLRLNSS